MVDTGRHYRLKSTHWNCEWTIYEKGVSRSCTLYDGYSELDPMNSEDIVLIRKILPKLYAAICDAVKKWVDAGDIDALKILEHKNLPAIITFADELGLTLGLGFDQTK